MNRNTVLTVHSYDIVKQDDNDDEVVALKPDTLMVVLKGEKIVIDVQKELKHLSS